MPTTRPRHDEGLAASALTLGEVLVAPARVGRLDEALDALADLEVTERTIEAGAAARLVQVRAQTGLRMPDCCVLLAAEAGDRIATFDKGLAAGATGSGFTVVQ